MTDDEVGARQPWIAVCVGCLRVKRDGHWTDEIAANPGRTVPATTSGLRRRETATRTIDGCFGLPTSEVLDNALDLFTTPSDVR
jgi:hypothetical protein